MATDNDRWALDEIEAARPALAQHVRFLVRDRDDAEDVCQEVMVRFLLQARDGLRPVSSIAWMRRVATNLVIDDARRRARSERVIDRLVERQPDGDVEDDVLAREWHEMLGASLAAVGPRERAVIALKANGHGHAEIAARIGSTETATRTALHRARARLRAQLIAVGAVAAKA